MDGIATIVVATDFTSIGTAAVTYALAMAEARHAHVYLLHVCEPLATVDASVGIEMAGIERAERAAQARLQDLALSRRGDTRIECAVEVGHAATEIVRAAERLHADMIVLGTHGRRGMRRALLGSVAESVLRAAPCPVLVVRPQLSTQRE